MPGYSAPLERIRVDPARIERVLAHPSDLYLESYEGSTEYKAIEAAFWKARRYRGRVMPAKVFAEIEPHMTDLNQNMKVRSCIRHWVDGVSWEDTGILEWFSHRIAIGDPKDQCWTNEMVAERYARLDRVYAQVRAERCLRSQPEVFPEWRAVPSAIEMHIGPGGEPIFADSGNHRLAMAIALGLREIPAMPGFIHEDALDGRISWSQARGERQVHVDNRDARGMAGLNSGT